MQGGAWVAQAFTSALLELTGAGSQEAGGQRLLPSGVHLRRGLPEEGLRRPGRRLVGPGDPLLPRPEHGDRLGSGV